MSTAVSGQAAGAMFQADRSALLDRATAGRLRPQGDAQAREVAAQFVGEAFFGLLMKEFRKGLDNDHLLSGGAGENTLRPYLDQILAQRMARSSHFDLSDAVYEMIRGPETAGRAAENRVGN